MVIRNLIGVMDRKRVSAFGLANKVDFQQINGGINSTYVYTGRVTMVGKSYFEHTINAFQGCSGAGIFLLDGSDQDSSETEEDYCRLIGVHVGRHPDCRNCANIGFLASSVPKPSPEDAFDVEYLIKRDFV